MEEENIEKRLEELTNYYNEFVNNSSIVEKLAKKRLEMEVSILEYNDKKRFSNAAEELHNALNQAKEQNNITNFKKLEEDFEMIMDCCRGSGVEVNFIQNNSNLTF